MSKILIEITGSPMGCSCVYARAVIGDGLPAPVILLARGAGSEEDTTRNRAAGGGVAV